MLVSGLQHDLTVTYIIVFSAQLSIVTIYHQAKLLQYYWLRSLRYIFHPCDLFITGSFYLLIKLFSSFVPFSNPLPYYAKWISPTEKNKYCRFHLVCNLKNKKKLEQKEKQTHKYKVHYLLLFSVPCAHAMPQVSCKYCPRSCYLLHFLWF